MPLVDIEVGLSEEAREVRDTAHKFAAEILRPAGRTLDAMTDPADAIAPGSVLWDVIRKHREVGLDDLDRAVSDLEPEEGVRVRCLVSEELGWGDVGLTFTFGCAGFHKVFALMSGRPALIERFASAENREVGCWAITEPDHGSDTLAISEPHFSDPKIRANCIARLAGDEYVINGQKAAWVSNGTIADVAALFCTIDGDQGFQGGGVAIVPLDLPGVSKGKPLDKIGQRTLNQGEIFFDEVRIPAEYMVIGKEAYAPIVEMVLTGANVSVGLTLVGLARAALEHALEYARERVQGGRPIFEHQSVRARLFKMFSQVEAARSLCRRVALYNSQNPPGLLQYSIASKVFATNTAFEVASGALQIYGGNGLSREYPIEKLLRDGRASMIEDGCNEVLSLVGASRL